ncbi:nucleotidyltransferase [Malaciobacter pacificus]|uniref:Nucleotidyltransferase domain-containing protein n=1 Tax=Malaciobacter pacificus TaxID=1080223 RepID=A0A5C2H543_9BACT|nr:nucleotidyltransferase domain-containing protein [Malaciobacter pacificus]QEP34057.1 nucleotidyltransferase domain-containing protein [Malaciobacter pacificus]GGD40080.1 nucleotidyltransferase [Malaciobacter pacificus]
MYELNRDLILSKIKELKPHYEQEGLLLLGIFGSYAKGTQNENSDIDILYDINGELFCQKHPGFSSFSRLTEIKEELKNIFKTNIDLATIDNPSKLFKNDALKDAIYV